MDFGSFPSIFEPILKNPTVENVTIFKQFIEHHIHKICSSGKEQLMLTAIFRIIAEINVPNKNEIICHLIETANIIISYTDIKSVMPMCTMLTILLKQIGVSPTYMAIQPNLSEELKLNIINCFEMIFRQALPEVVIKFYNRENLNLLAQVLSISEYILANETYKLLRTKAIKCIISVFQVHDEDSSKNVKQRLHVANVMFMLIPKIVQTLTNISIGSSTLPEILKTNSINAIGRILKLIFEDYRTKQNISQQTKLIIEKSMSKPSASPPTPTPSQSQSGNLSVDDKINNIIRKERDEVWLHHASTKLIGVVKKLETLTKSKSKKMRQELYNLSVTLLDRCQRNLECCVPILLKINIALFEFETKKQYKFYDEHLIDITEELFTEHMFRLPRIIHSGSEEEKAAAFVLLRNFMSILRSVNRLQITLSNENVNENLLSILLSIVELEKSNKLIEINIDVTNPNDGKIIDTLYFDHKNCPWKHFIHIPDEESVQCILSICEHLIEHRQMSVFVHEYLLRLLSKNASNSNEVLIIIQMLLSCERNNTCESVHYSILDNLLCEYRWKLLTFMDNNCNEKQIDYIGEGSKSVDIVNHKISLNEIKTNILHTCLVIETVGCFAKYMKENYRQFHLMKSIHFISEKLASKQYMIRASALAAIESMKLAYNLNTVNDFMQHNEDYLIHSINKSIVKPSELDAALHILENMLSYNLTDVKTHLQTIVPTIIAESSKASHGNVLAFMQVFKMILSTIRDTISKCTKNVAVGDDIDRSIETRISQNHFEIWLEILDADRDVNPSSNDMDPSSENQNNEKVSDENTTLIALTVDILKQVIPCLTTTNVQLKLITLESINIGLDILKEREDELLPVVHLLWEPIVQQCFQSNHKSLRRHTIQLVTKLTTYTNNFLTKRSISQFFPHVKQYLHDFAIDKQLHMDEYSQDFKTLKELLSEIPHMLTKLDIEERELDHILNSVLMLDSLEKTCSSLREHTSIFFKKLSTFDICTVYLRKPSKIT